MALRAFAALAALALLGCSRRSAPAPAPAAAVIEAACPPLPQGAVSDDDTPTVRGMSPTTDVLTWAAAHEQGRDATLRWLALHYWGTASGDRAESTFDSATCGAVRVGEPAEDALFCVHELPTDRMQVHALVVVVRGGKIVPVLDVGLGERAMDFPDSRALDLALKLDPSGTTVEIAERAPEGTTLVEPPSGCRAREAFLHACDVKLAAQPHPESLLHAGSSSGAEGIGSLDECTVVRSPDGRPVIFREAQRSAESQTPATLHGCKFALQAARDEQREAATWAPDLRAVARQSRAWLSKACRERGRYVWRDGRFVKASSAAARVP